MIAFPKNAPYGTVPDDTVWNLGFFAGPATSVFSALGIGLLCLYRIDAARHAAMVRELEARGSPPPVRSGVAQSG